MWKSEITEQYKDLADYRIEHLINFIENLLEEAKKEERERIINEIENVVNWLFMNYEEKIDIMKERLEEFKTNK